MLLCNLLKQKGLVITINGSTSGAILGIITVGTDKNLIINTTVASGTVIRSTTICYVTA